MKQYLPVTVIFILLFAGMVSFHRAPFPAPADKVEVQFFEQADAFEKYADTLAHIADAYAEGKATLDALMQSYHRCRNQYKRMEIITEYFFPSTAESLNGPLVNEADEEEGTQNIIYPEGLQVIESLVYDVHPEEQAKTIRTECFRLLSYSKRLRFMASSSQFSDWQVIEAAKQELVRIFILSLAGYDIPASGRHAPEAVEALKGFRQVLLCYGGGKADPSLRRINGLIDDAIIKLNTYADADAIDRYALIRGYMNPMFTLLEDLRRALDLKGPSLDQPLRVEADSYWKTTSYNLGFFSRYDRGKNVNKEVVELGRTLFFDPLLSGNHQRSCGSCHQPDKGFTDGLPKSLAFEFKGNVTRNAPGLMHVAFQNGYFMDSRAVYLEDQVKLVTENPDEMHGSLDAAVLLLKESAGYRQLFRRAFAGTADTVITARGVMRAIAWYERSLFRFDSRFDRDIRGEGKYLTADEISGFNLFMGKALCGTCHFAPAFNGTLPPFFLKTESEVIGVPADLNRHTSRIDPDEGRGKITGLPLQNFAFKTPTVRNAAVTGPYMHNGVFSTLSEVMDFYNVGGASGWNIPMDNQTLPFDSLRLSPTELSQLVAFIGALTDTAGLGLRPSSLPSIDSHPELDQRKIGGEY